MVTRMYFCNTHSLICAVWHCASWLRCCLGISPQISDFRHMPPHLPIVRGHTAHTRIYCQSTVSLQEAKVPPASSSKANVPHNLTWLVQKITRASFVFFPHVCVDGHHSQPKGEWRVGVAKPLFIPEEDHPREDCFTLIIVDWEKFKSSFQSFPKLHGRMKPQCWPRGEIMGIGS